MKYNRHLARWVIGSASMAALFAAQIPSFTAEAAVHHRVHHRFLQDQQDGQYGQDQSDNGDNGQNNQDGQNDNSNTQDGQTVRYTYRAAQNQNVGNGADSSSSDNGNSGDNAGTSDNGNSGNNTAASSKDNSGNSANSSSSAGAVATSSPSQTGSTTSTSLPPGVRYDASVQPRAGLNATWQQKFDAVMAVANSKLGTPYIWGHNEDRGQYGFDCSNFTAYVYHHALGYRMSGASRVQANSVGWTVPKSQMRPGDLLIDDHGRHVGIYAGNGRMIQEGGGLRRVGFLLVTPGSYWYRHITAVKRMF